jgi:uncharacterized membrane protein YgcG
MGQLLDDSRNRPVVFETSAEPTPRRLRRPVRVLAGATLVFASLAGAAGLAFGGSAVWSVVGPKPADNVPAPLWFPPPPAVSTAPRHITAIDPDADHSALTGTKAPATTDRQRGRSGGGSGKGGPGKSSGGSGGSGSGSSGSGGGSGGSDDNQRSAATGQTVQHTAAAPTTHEAPATTDQEEPEPGHDENRRGAGGSGGGGSGKSGGDNGGSSGGGGRH